MLIAVLVLLVRLAIDRSKAGRAAEAIRAASDRAFGSMWLPTVLLIALVVLTFVILATVLNHGYDVALGVMVATQLDYLPTWQFYAIVAVAVMAYLVYLAAMNRLPMASSAWRHHRRLWRLVGWSLLVVCIQVPIVYGAAVKRAWYPIAKVTTNAVKGEALCGVLLLEDNGDLALWRYVDHRGQLLIIPKSTVSLSQVGRLVDLLEIARSALTQPQADALECSQW